MKNLNHFEAFKLEKSQMAKVSGGVVCQVYYSDGLGGSFVQSYKTDDKKAMKDALEMQHPDAQVSCW
ncbi:hypothetical protein [Bacteroides heparinolyticus]|uniref:hypothetical protein n=1 Tax=Prevotella heparinolytica TaxID=28113 RepID=UPI00359FC7F7